jgi:serine/threonine-protein kinase
MDRIGTTVGNYHLQQILGRGGMGTVYSGEHVYIGKRVAVKVLHPRFARYEDAVKRFLREARAASSINHPNIVDVTDFGPMPDGGVFFVMEFLEGTSLEDLIEKKGALPLHRGLNVANQLALALAAAHDKGIIHRDLKPDNIMLIRKPGRREMVRRVDSGDESSTAKYVVEKEDAYEFVKILDFGIAKVLTPDEHSPRQTMAGAVFGTPEYMSPEAARGEDVDLRADVYSLGVILFDMLTGRPPFEAQAAAEVLAMQISHPPPSPREVAPHLEITEQAEALILKAMQKKPDDRHQNLDDFRAELQNCYGSISFRRHSKSAQAPQVEERPKRLTDELEDWIHDGKGGLSLEEARRLAMPEAVQEFSDDPTRPDIPKGDD